MYEVFEQLLKERGITAYRVSKETGVSTATLTSWKNGVYTPKPDKLRKIADYLGVSVEYLMTGKEPESYYTNDDTAKEAESIFRNKEMRILFDAAKDASPEGLRIATDMLQAMKRKENGGDNQ